LNSNSETILSQVCKRAKGAVDQVVIATTTNPADDQIVRWARDNHISIFRGSEEDVLDRYYKAALEYNAHTIVRITSDCPCIDPAVISGAVALFNIDNVDYVSNTQVRTFPHGLDVEVFSLHALKQAWKKATEPSHREHVTPYIYRSGLFKCADYTDSNVNNKDIRVTVDTEEDYAVVCAIYELLGENFSHADIVALFDKYKWLSSINKNIIQKKVYHSIEEEIDDAYGLLMRSGMYEVAARLKR
jgi:spore coat polysaccharide biosynthesis protein SpsF